MFFFSPSNPARPSPASGAPINAHRNISLFSPRGGHGGPPGGHGGPHGSHGAPGPFGPPPHGGPGHHGTGRRPFGPYWGYHGTAGPEFYFGRPHDPMGPMGGYFYGAPYHGWFRGYGMFYPRTWLGGWFGIVPMSAPLKDDDAADVKPQADTKPHAAESSWIAHMRDWWQNL